MSFTQRHSKYGHGTENIVSNIGLPWLGSCDISNINFSALQKVLVYKTYMCNPRLKNIYSWFSVSFHSETGALGDKVKHHEVAKD